MVNMTDEELIETGFKLDRENSEPVIKQLVVVNMAVPMSLSQLAVQISHASMLNILKQGEWTDNVFELNCDTDPDLSQWLRDHFTLVICKVWGKKAIMGLEAEARNLGLVSAIMEDYGHTTAIAIGPASDDKLFPFKRLTLL